jgi:hypothetical protein
MESVNCLGIHSSGWLALINCARYPPHFGLRVTRNWEICQASDLTDLATIYCAAEMDSESLQMDQNGVCLNSFMIANNNNQIINKKYSS